MKTREVLFAGAGAAAGILGTIVISECADSFTEDIQTDTDDSTARLDSLCDSVEVIYNATGPHFAPGEEEWQYATTIPFYNGGPSCSE